MKRNWAIVLVLFFCVGSSAQSIDWLPKIREIKIFQTHRTDVERLLSDFEIATELKTSDTYVKYERDGVYLHISYSNGRCSRFSGSDFDVDKNVVLDVTVNLYEPLPISMLGLDVSKYRRTEIEDVANRFEYSNDVDGISFSGSISTFNAFRIEPSKRQLLGILRCKAKG